MLSHLPTITQLLSGRAGTRPGLTPEPELIITSPLAQLSQGPWLGDLSPHASQTPAYGVEKPTPVDSCLDGVDVINGIIKNNDKAYKSGRGKL